MSKVKVVRFPDHEHEEREKHIAYIARVSNPNATLDMPHEKLLHYLVRNKHWSPFEMVNECLEIETTRDIARQILRHRSFSFQEFSQRYAVADGYEISEARAQDEKNRQNSLPIEDKNQQEWWRQMQERVLKECRFVYSRALEHGIAKEVARKVLPEGLTTSKMYMNGSIRSWIHYIQVRTDPSTQKEHRIVAEQCREALAQYYPLTFGKDSCVI
jgi:thymidylate synthase (FAD)